MTARERLAWAALVGFGLVIRLADLGARAMSHDESLHAMYSRYLATGAGYKHNPMMHGPLLFHLNALVDLVLPDTDFTYRLVPALLGAGAVAMLILYRRWLGRKGAWWAAALVCVEPSLLFYSRYLRNDIHIVVFTLLMAWALLRYRETRAPRHLLWLATGLGLAFATKEVSFIHGTVFGCACLVFATVDLAKARTFRISAFARHPHTQSAALLLLLALPFASPLLLRDLPWDELAKEPEATQRRVIAVALAVFLPAAGAGIAYFHYVGRLRTWIASLCLFWTLQIPLYTTFFTNTLYGLASGVGGSLGYWLPQHDVVRGNPHPLFYLSLLLLYTPVLLVALGLSARHPRRGLTPFLLFWTLGNLAVYSWAGERMPWLLTHITLPLCLLAGPVLTRAWQAAPSWRSRLSRVVLAAGCVHLVFNAFLAAGPHRDGPVEPLVYAHSGPNLKTAVDLIDAHLTRYPGTSGFMDPQYTWPMIWYFRDLPVRARELSLGEIPDDVLVLLVPPGDRDLCMRRGWTPRLTVRMTTWPRPQYHELSRKNLANLIRHRSTRRKLTPYLLHRGQPEWGPREWPGPHRFLLLTRSPFETTGKTGPETP